MSDVQQKLQSKEEEVQQLKMAVQRVESEHENAQKQLQEASQVVSNLQQVQQQLSTKDGEVARVKGDLEAGNAEREQLRRQLAEAS